MLRVSIGQAIGCALVLLSISVAGWWFWYAQHSGGPNIMIGCAFGCALVLLLIGLVGWWFWYTQLSGHPNQMVVSIREQGAITSTCWGGFSGKALPGFVASSGTIIRARAVSKGKIEKTLTWEQKHPVTAISCNYTVTDIASVDTGGTLHIWDPWNRKTASPVVMIETCKDQKDQSACALRAVSWKPLTQKELDEAFDTYGRYPPPWAKNIALGGDSGTVLVLSVPDGKVVARYELPPSTQKRTLQWSSDGKYLAAGGFVKNEGKGIVRVWDVQTQQEVSTYWGHTKAVNALAWSPDNDRIASASDDTMVQIWNIATARPALTYRGHTQEVNAISWVKVISWGISKDLIVSGSNDRTVQVWYADTGKLYFTHPHPQAVTALACNGAMIISGSSDGTLDYYWIDEFPLVLF